MTRAAVLVVLAGVTACAPRPLVERAIAARGGPIAGLVRDSDVQVAMGFPGPWQWRTVAAAPERYAWSIVTNDLPHHYLFDGAVVRAFVGSGLVSEDAAVTAPLRTSASSPGGMLTAARRMLTASPPSVLRAALISPPMARVSPWATVSPMPMPRRELSPGRRTR